VILDFILLFSCFNVLCIIQHRAAICNKPVPETYFSNDNTSSSSDNCTVRCRVLSMAADLLLIWMMTSWPVCQASWRLLSVSLLSWLRYVTACCLGIWGFLSCNLAFSGQLLWCKLCMVGCWASVVCNRMSCLAWKSNNRSWQEIGCLNKDFKTMH